MENIVDVAIVVFDTEKDILAKAIDSVNKNLVSTRVYLLDNSHDHDYRDLAQEYKCEYYQSDKNLGYGKGNNKIFSSIPHPSRYFVIMNPDVVLQQDCLQHLVEVLEKDEEIGIAVPKVKNPDESTQYLCHRQPTPFDLMLRRFMPQIFKKLFRKRMMNYEYRNEGYHKTMKIETASGSFMCMRSELFKSKKGFDDRFFLYLEDVDFSKRVLEEKSIVYCPKAELIHYHAKKSYSDIKHLCCHCYSAFQFFNKWSWKPFW